MCTGASGDKCGCSQGEMCLYILVSATPRRSPPASHPFSVGEAGAHQAGQQVEVSSCNPELPVPRRAGCPSSTAGVAKPSRSWRWAQSLWAHGRGYPGTLVKQGLEKGAGAVPEVPKLTRRDRGPSGSGSSGWACMALPCAGCISKTPGRPAGRQHRSHTLLSGAWPRVPTSHVPWPLAVPK